MKKVINNELLETKMLEAITLLCDTVKVTLGPKGRNVIIDHSDFSPFITNDGVTIASNISSDDPIINTILELAKESSIKTNEVVGDGTTTTLVLLESLFKRGLQIIKEGYNPLILKEELDIEVNNLIKEIKKKSSKPKLKDIENITTVAGNSKEIGKIIKTAYKKVKENIFIKESENELTTLNYLEGYFFETILASSYFLKKNETITYSNANIFITLNTLEYLESISPIINNAYQTKTPLIIIAKDYSSLFINEIVSMYLDNNINIILLKSPGYGEEELTILEDLSIITNGVITNSFENINLNVLGQIKNITINSETTNISFTPNKKIEEYLKTIQKENNKRIAMLTKGLVEINVGSPTTTERREKKMRFDDALCALKSAKEGILPGSGLTLFELSNKLNSNTKAATILKEALKEPMYQILENAALDKETITNKIIQENYRVLYNITKNTYESIKVTSVTDTTNVIITALKNASSIASMLLTTNNLIINEFKEETYPEL